MAPVMFCRPCEKKECDHAGPCPAKGARWKCRCQGRPNRCFDGPGWGGERHGCTPFARDMNPDLSATCDAQWWARSCALHRGTHEANLRHCGQAVDPLDVVDLWAIVEDDIRTVHRVEPGEDVMLAFFSQFWERLSRIRSRRSTFKCGPDCKRRGGRRTCWNCGAPQDCKGDCQ